MELPDRGGDGGDLPESTVSYSVLSEGILQSDRRAWTVQLLHRHPEQHPDVPARMDLVREGGLTFGSGGAGYGAAVLDGAGALRVIDPSGAFLHVLRSSAVETDLMMAITAPSLAGSGEPLRYRGYVRTETVRRGRSPRTEVPTADFRLYDGLSGVGGQEAVTGAQDGDPFHRVQEPRQNLAGLLAGAFGRISPVAGVLYASGFGADGSEDPRAIALPVEAFKEGSSLSAQLATIADSLGCRIYQDVRLGGVFAVRRRRRIGAAEPLAWYWAGRGRPAWLEASVSESRVEPPAHAADRSAEDVLLRRLGELTVARDYQAAEDAASEEDEEDLTVSLLRDPFFARVEGVSGGPHSWRAREEGDVFEVEQVAPGAAARIGADRKVILAATHTGGLVASGQVVGTEQWLRLSAHLRAPQITRRGASFSPAEEAGVRVLLYGLSGNVTHAYEGNVRYGGSRPAGDAEWKAYDGPAGEAPASIFELPPTHSTPMTPPPEIEWADVGAASHRRAGGPDYHRRVEERRSDARRPEDSMRIGEPRILEGGQPVQTFGEDGSWLKNRPDAPDHYYGPDLTDDLDDAYWWHSRYRWDFNTAIEDQEAQDVRFENVTVMIDGEEERRAVGRVTLGENVGYHRLIVATGSGVEGSGSYQASIKVETLPEHGTLFLSLFTAGSDEEPQRRAYVPVTQTGTRLETEAVDLDFEGADSGAVYVGTMLEYVRWQEYPAFMIPPPPEAGRIEVEFLPPFGANVDERYELAAPHLELVDAPGEDPARDWNARIVLDPERPEAYRQTAELDLMLSDVALRPFGAAWSAAREWTDRYGVARTEAGGFTASTGASREDVAELLVLDRLSQQREDAWLVEMEITGFYPPGTALVLVDGVYVPVEVECTLAPAEVTKGIWRRLPPEEGNR